MTGSCLKVITRKGKSVPTRHGKGEKCRSGEASLGSTLRSFHVASPGLLKGKSSTPSQPPPGTERRAVFLAGHFAVQGNKGLPSLLTHFLRRSQHGRAGTIENPFKLFLYGCAKLKAEEGSSHATISSSFVQPSGAFPPLPHPQFERNEWNVSRGWGGWVENGGQGPVGTNSTGEIIPW